LFRKPAIRISPASVLALIALFVAVGGVSYAAVQIDGKDIKNNSIPGKKLTNGAVTNAKVKANSLTANRLTSAARASLRGAEGAQGPAGREGARGPQGLAGPQGAAGTALAYAQVNPVPAGDPTFVAARTSGFSGLTRPAGGRYCLALDAALVGQAFSGGLPARPTVATVEYTNSGSRSALVSVLVYGVPEECPPNNFEVATIDDTGVFVQDVAFTLIVP
jgi:hypothetical protein